MKLHIYIITLLRSEARLKPLVEQLNSMNLSFSVIYGFDGVSLEDSLLTKHLASSDYFNSKYGRNITKNEVCCALSHHEALKSFDASDNDVALVLEDDAYFLDSPHKFFEVYFSKFSEGFDQLLLGYPARSEFEAKNSKFCEPVNIIFNMELDAKKYVFGVPIKNKNYGAMAYIVGKAGARKLLKAYPLKSVFDDTSILDEVGVRTLHMRPYIVIERPGALSSITGNYRKFSNSISLRKKISVFVRGTFQNLRLFFK